ncbi:hypothetical protein [Microcoleus sp.]
MGHWALGIPRFLENRYMLSQELTIARVRMSLSPDFSGNGTAVS